MLKPIRLIDAEDPRVVLAAVDVVCGPAASILSLIDVMLRNTAIAGCNGNGLEMWTGTPGELNLFLPRLAIALKSQGAPGTRS